MLPAGDGYTTPFIPQILETLSLWQPPVPLVWNTSGYETVESLRRLDGVVDVYLPDLKHFTARSGRLCQPEGELVVLLAHPAPFVIQAEQYFDRRPAAVDPSAVELHEDQERAPDPVTRLLALTIGPYL